LCDVRAERIDVDACGVCNSAKPVVDGLGYYLESLKLLVDRGGAVAEPRW
jgi:hypothetical protein